MSDGLPTPLHVLGSGSIGLLFASSIRRRFPSYPLTMLLRPAHRSRIRPRPSPDAGRPHHDRGGHFIAASLTAPDGSSVRGDLPADVVPPAGTDGTAAAAAAATIRNLLLATKAPDAATALRSVAHRLDPRGADVVILCNGALAVGEELREVLDAAGRRVSARSGEGPGGDRGGGGGAEEDGAVRLVLASTTHGAHRGPSDGPRDGSGGGYGGDDGDGDGEEGGSTYRVVHAGLGRTYVQSRAFARLFDAAGLRASYAPPAEMYALLWKKLAANCAINPLTALRGCKNGDLFRTEGGVYGDDTKAMDEIVKEVAAVAAAEVGQFAASDGLQLGEDSTSCGLLIDELGYVSLRSFVDDVVRDTADNTSSMLQDVIARRHPTEVSYLNGYVARIGKKKHNLDVSYNEDICCRVEKLTNASVGPQNVF